MRRESEESGGSWRECQAERRRGAARLWGVGVVSRAGGRKNSERKKEGKREGGTDSKLERKRERKRVGISRRETEERRSRVFHVKRREWRKRTMRKRNVARVKKKRNRKETAKQMKEKQNVGRGKRL